MAAVIRLGSFAGGSFGTAGNPSRLQPYWAIDCRASREARAAGGVGAIAPWVFASEGEALRALPRVEAEELTRAARERREKAQQQATAEAVLVAVGAAVLGLPASQCRLVPATAPDAIRVATDPLRGPAVRQWVELDPRPGHAILGRSE